MLLINIFYNFINNLIATIIPLIAIQNTTIAVSMQMRLQQKNGTFMNNNEPMVIY